MSGQVHVVTVELIAQFYPRVLVALLPVRGGADRGGTAASTINRAARM
jgi:hypothetical protein